MVAATTHSPARSTSEPAPWRWRQRWHALLDFARQLSIVLGVAIAAATVLAGLLVGIAWVGSLQFVTHAAAASADEALERRVNARIAASEQLAIQREEAIRQALATQQTTIDGVRTDVRQVLEILLQERRPTRGRE